MIWACFFVVPAAQGAGFQLNEFSVAAMGRAQAGEPAMMDTAAAMARNPAVIGAFTRPELNVVYHRIEPNIDVEGMVDLTVEASANDVAPAADVPGLYYVHPFDERWSFGFSINSYYGLQTDYGRDFAGSEFAEKTSIVAYYFSPTVSWKVSDTVMLGLAVSYVYGEGELGSFATPHIENEYGMDDGTTLMTLEGNGDAFGYQLGMLWQAMPTTRIGLRYQSRVNLHLEGDVLMFDSYHGIPIPHSGTLTIHLPDVFEVGVVHAVNDRLELLAGAQYTGWSSFRNLTGKVDSDNVYPQGTSVLLKEQNWEDVWRYSVGAEYRFSDQLSVRAGFGLDESPVPEGNRHLSIPDDDRTWYSFGASYDFAGYGSADVALTYLTGDKAPISEVFEPEEDGLLRTEYEGRLTSTNAWIFSVGYSYRF